MNKTVILSKAEVERCIEMFDLPTTMEVMRSRLNSNSIQDAFDALKKKKIGVGTVTTEDGIYRGSSLDECFYINDVLHFLKTIGVEIND